MRQEMTVFGDNSGISWTICKQSAVFGDNSGISWTICKQSAPCSRQITTPTPHHSIFTGRMLFLMPTNSVKALKANSLIQTVSTNFALPRHMYTKQHIADVWCSSWQSTESQILSLSLEMNVLSTSHELGTFWPALHRPRMSSSVPPLIMITL